MIYKASVWNGGVYDDEENRQREEQFLILIRNIKNAEIVETHLEYLIFKAPNDKVMKKVENIIKNKFGDDGWIIQQRK